MRYCPPRASCVWPAYVSRWSCWQWLTNGINIEWRLLKRKLTFSPFSTRLYYVRGLLAPRIISNVVTVKADVLSEEGQDSHEIRDADGMQISNSAALLTCLNSWILSWTLMITLIISRIRGVNNLQLIRFIRSTLAAGESFLRTRLLGEVLVKIEMRHMVFLCFNLPPKPNVGSSRGLTVKLNRRGL